MTPSPPAVAFDVKEALADGRGVVALESTLIAHGLPWPQNLETAQESERAVRAAGAVPATIAVLAGTVHLGLTEAELERIARSGTFLKASRRDLAAVLARRLDAATTVSATLWIARRHGVGVLATGGLGGVHRGARETFDVSTDLDELARADGAAVVCSGFKSILDIPATLEVLETLGVPVVGYQTEELPGFTSRSSGLALESRVNSAAEAADLIQAHRRLGVPGAVVLAHPVPADVAVEREAMETSLAKALEEAGARQITGKAVTPFLLDCIRHDTAGRSLQANKALIVANARVAGEVAAALAARR